MHLLEVEKLTGLSGKIIKLYESIGLINPSKGGEHGVKTYTLKEVQILKSIKFLRSIGVSLEEIKEIIASNKSLDSVMENKLLEIKTKEENLKTLKKLCKKIKSSEENFDGFNISNYEEEVSSLKTSGIDLLGKDRERRKKLAIVLLRILIVLFLISIIVLLFLATKKEPISIPVLVILIAFPIIFIVGIMDTVKDSIREIENAEIKKVI